MTDRPNRRVSDHMREVALDFGPGTTINGRAVVDVIEEWAAYCDEVERERDAEADSTLQSVIRVLRDCRGGGYSLDFAIETLSEFCGDPHTPGTLAYDAETARLIEERGISTYAPTDATPTWSGLVTKPAMLPRVKGDNGERDTLGEAVRAAVEGGDDG